jgi:hypothetical protein
MRVAIALACSILAAAAGAATAQVTSEQQNAIRANCRSDFMSKCSGVTPGGREALMCLQKNVATLSAGCRTAVSATMPKAEPSPAPATAASTPAARVELPAPASAIPATAAPAAPEARLAAPTAAAPKPPAQPKPAVAARPAAPKAATASAPAAAKPAPPAPPAPATVAPERPIVNAAVMLRACKLDLIRHCAGVEVGDGRKLACLNEHAPKLTVRCRTALNVTAPVR